MTAGIARPSVASPLPDSVVTWRFLADGGDSWGGTLIADTGAYAAGDTLPGAFGVYTVLATEDRGIDLSAVGLEDGQVFVAWYWDAQTTQFLATRTGPGTPAGTAFLGSELDFAWTGVAWSAFGQAGVQQADAAVIAADTRFTFVFEANSGDRWGGLLFGLSAQYDVGSMVATTFGRYRITAEEAVGAGFAAGSVRLTGAYFDSASGGTFAIQAADGVVEHGGSGLGSELAVAWNGAAWRSFGVGGGIQADPPGQALFAFAFEADSGDRWFGNLLDDRSRFDVGSLQITPYGRYVIQAETALNTSLPIANGTVWINGYFDSLSGLTLGTWNLGLFGKDSGSGGLGSEVDAAWTGLRWAHFGEGGARQADAKAYSRYEFVFEAQSGDRWFGALWDDRTLYDIGSTLVTPFGRYRITGEAPVEPNAGVADGTVWVGSYYDARSGLTLGTWHWGRFSQASATGGLGSELDAAWTGRGWAHFGLGGTRQADATAYARYDFVFEADSGDRWWGALWDDRSLHAQGATIPTAHGRYVITGKADVADNPAIADGTVWVGSYYDSYSGRTLETWYWGRFGQATSTGGLGRELDAAWTGTGWAHFGLGGARQADVKSYAAFSWVFEANSGDRWSGGLWEDRTRYEPGDVIATPFGRYVILAEAPREAIEGLQDGTVWVTGYFDALSGRSLATWYWDRFGTATTNAGLGNELDAAWTGTGWAHFGLGGLRQADAASGALDPWIG
jgi:hypothetical protein